MNLFEKSLLKYLSPAMLSHFHTFHIGIAGAGGLGSNCAHSLVRAGFKKFTIVDFDFVDYSNLNRQFYFTDQVGAPKVNALSDNLRRINADLDIRIFRERITEDNADSYFENCDVIVEAFDSADAKCMIVEKYGSSGKLVVSATGLAGWEDADAIVTQKIGESLYIIGDCVTPVGQHYPPLSPRVAVAAAKEANVVLRWAIDKSTGDADERQTS
jgi:sulfur carrier protein ThiS adenylyltransferase